MKKITLISTFFAFAFSFFGTAVSAQVYEPAPYWEEFEVSRGINLLEKQMQYDFGNQVVTIRVMINGAPMYIPNYADYSEIYEEYTLTGSGIDIVNINVSASPNLGWRAWVRVLDSNYDDVISAVVLFSQTQPLAPLQILAPDPFNYSGSLASRTITYHPIVSSIFDPPDQEQYALRMYCRLSSDNGYDITRWFDITSFSQAQGLNFTFNLPLDIGGGWCMDWWMTARHVSVTPQYWPGERIVWEAYPPCFTFDFSTSVEEEEEQFEQLEEVEKSMIAFPNPTVDGSVTITSDEVVNYVVSNALGQRVAFGKLLVGVNQINDFAGLSSGMYTLQVENGQFVRIQKQ